MHLEHNARSINVFPCIYLSLPLHPPDRQVLVGRESIRVDSKSIVNFCVFTQRFTIGPCSVRKKIALLASNHPLRLSCLQVNKLLATGILNGEVPFL